MKSETKPTDASDIILGKDDAAIVLRSKDGGETFTQEIIQPIPKDNDIATNVCMVALAVGIALTEPDEITRLVDLLEEKLKEFEITEKEGEKE